MPSVQLGPRARLLVTRPWAAFAGLVSAEDAGIGSVVIGHDMRASSPPLAAAFADGVTGQGLDVVLIGLASTDMLYFASGYLDMPGAMFTASHNPATYNGIKLCRAGAAPVGQDTGLREIEDLVTRGVPDGPGGGTVRSREMLAEYADYLVVPKVDALQAAVAAVSPAAVLVPSSAEGKEVAARLALRIGSGLITDAVDLEAGDEGPVATQSVFAASFTTKSRVSTGTPVITVKPNSAAVEAAPAAGAVEELVRRTGCGLLVDVNNVAVAAHNLGYQAETYLDLLPHDAIGEIHVAGHTADPDPAADLLIDSHDAPVAERVWELLGRLLDLAGPRPVLLERDGNLPPFAALMAERDRAAAMLSQKERVDA